MSARCIGEPISWLLLERYHLGEVSDAERAAIAGHLESCQACAAAHRAILEDDETALPPLAVQTKQATLAIETNETSQAKKAKSGRARLTLIVTGGLAMAAAAAISVGGSWRHAERGGEGPTARTKGDTVAFSLVRDDDERIDEAGGSFREGDRFKAVVSCPPSMGATFDLVVYDAAGASFPLAAGRVACGNGVPLPGAFRLSGSTEERVCLVWATGGDVERSGLLAGPPADRSLCKSLMEGEPQ